MIPELLDEIFSYLNGYTIAHVISWLVSDGSRLLAIACNFQYDYVYANLSWRTLKDLIMGLTPPQPAGQLQRRIYAGVAHKPGRGLTKTPAVFMSDSMLIDECAIPSSTNTWSVESCPPLTVFHVSDITMTDQQLEELLEVFMDTLTTLSLSEQENLTLRLSAMPSYDDNFDINAIQPTD
ncbi:hypothetical protein BGZ83_009710 [Gryganskiella cystojenkinii]|nr:hypothetical protein BGZ83_009710 [Gryganskiella cystojenkinii]